MKLFLKLLVAIVLISFIALTFFPAYKQKITYAISDERAASVDKALVSSNTEFAFKIFKELNKEDGDKNIFISPLSISMALAMTYNGAEGTTKDAITKTLEFGNMSLEKVNQEYLNLIESLENVDRQVDLKIANSIWMREQFGPLVKSSFIERIKAFYKGEVFTRDFENPQTLDEINGWVGKKTNGKINKIIQEIEPQVVMFLINAIYFKGEWTTKFDEAKTMKDDFFLSNGSTVKVDMMSTSGNFSYYEGKNFEVVRLPYGRDKIAMYVFLPHEGVTLDSLIGNLNQTTFDEYIVKLHPISDLTVKLPKFRIEYGTKRLNNALTKLGMGIAFGPDANFEGIADVKPLFIGYVDHKAVVEVNEKGTEAAAATVVALGRAVRPSFIANRPFLFVIRDDRSGTILFMGKMVNPALG